MTDRAFLTRENIERRIANLRLRVDEDNEIARRWNEAHPNEEPLDIVEFGEILTRAKKRATEGGGQ